jgi:hypothetical protein
MSDFEKRLEKAVERGQLRSDARAVAAEKAALSEDELRRLHASARLELSDHIEACLRKLPEHLPGFRYESIVDERGWGGQVHRDDFGRVAEQGRTNLYSRMEITIRPFSAYRVLELASKATIRNKELFNRSHYQKLGEADTAMYREMIDRWIIEFAEQYAAT